MISGVSTNPKFNSCGTLGGDRSFLLSHGLGTSRARLCHREYTTPENGSEAQVLRSQTSMSWPSICTLRRCACSACPPIILGLAPFHKQGLKSQAAFSETFLTHYLKDLLLSDILLRLTILFSL